MALPDGYAICARCKGVYRPGVDESVQGHYRATGHHPTGNQPPPDPATRAAERPVSPGELLTMAAARLTEQRDVIEGLRVLADQWKQSTDAVRAEDGRMLAGYLARPPVYALDDDGPEPAGW